MAKRQTLFDTMPIEVYDFTGGFTFDCVHAAHSWWMLRLLCWQWFWGLIPGEARWSRPLSDILVNLTSPYPDITGPEDPFWRQFLDLFQKTFRLGEDGNWRHPVLADRRLRVIDNYAVRTRGASPEDFAIAKGRSRSIPPTVRAAVFARDGRACVRCGRLKNLTLDHIIPFIRGGPHTEENLRVLCRRCNSRKGADWEG